MPKLSFKQQCQLHSHEYPLRTLPFSGPVLNEDGKKNCLMWNHLVLSKTNKLLEKLVLELSFRFYLHLLQSIAFKHLNIQTNSQCKSQFNCRMNIFKPHKSCHLVCLFQTQIHWYPYQILMFLPAAMKSFGTLKYFQESNDRNKLLVTKNRF